MVFMSWLTSAGEFNKDITNQDAGKLTAFYHNKGYAKAGLESLSSILTRKP